jgi:hypothetical protein
MRSAWSTKGAGSGTLAGKGESVRFVRSIALPVIGIGVFLAGFVYDVLFAGIPYQDPTPELQAKWEFHRNVAGVFYRAGGVVFLVGLVALPIMLKRTRK